MVNSRILKKIAKKAREEKKGKIPVKKLKTPGKNIYYDKSLNRLRDHKIFASLLSRKNKF